MKKYIIPVIIPSSESKKDWVFCNQKNNLKSITEDEIIKIIEEHLKKIEEKMDVEIALMGDFLGNSEKFQNEILDEISKYMSEGKINEIRVSAKPQEINKKVLKRLKKNKVKTIELQVYSSNDYILNKIGVGYTLKDIKRVSKMIRWSGFKLAHQMLIGLPESTKIDDINTAKTLIKLKPKIVSVNPVIVIKGTELEKDVKENKYKPLTTVQAVETCKELVKLFNEKNIEIIAIGFQPMDNTINQLSYTNEVIAGPFHLAFRQLVESGLWYDAIVNKIKKLNTKVMQVEITINQKDLNNVIGYKNENIQKLKDIYDVELIITPNEKIKPGKSKIKITKTYSEFAE